MGKRTNLACLEHEDGNLSFFIFYSFWEGMLRFSTTKKETKLEPLDID